MKFLLDTHLLLWAAGEPDKLSVSAKAILLDESNLLFFQLCKYLGDSYQAQFGA